MIQLQLDAKHEKLGYLIDKTSSVPNWESSLTWLRETIFLTTSKYESETGSRKHFCPKYLQSNPD